MELHKRRIMLGDASIPNLIGSFLRSTIRFIVVIPLKEWQKEVYMLAESVKHSYMTEIGVLDELSPSKATKRRLFNSAV